MLTSIHPPCGCLTVRLSLFVSTSVGSLVVEVNTVRLCVTACEDNTNQWLGSGAGWQIDEYWSSEYQWCFVDSFKFPHHSSPPRRGDRAPRSSAAWWFMKWDSVLQPIIPASLNWDRLLLTVRCVDVHEAHGWCFLFTLYSLVCVCMRVCVCACVCVCVCVCIL